MSGPHSRAASSSLEPSVAGEELVRINERLAFIRGDEIHFVKISTDSQGVQVGCVQMSWDAWELIETTIKKAWSK